MDLFLTKVIFLSTALLSLVLQTKCGGVEGTLNTAVYLNELVIDGNLIIKPDEQFEMHFETRIVNFKWYDIWEGKDTDIFQFRAILSDVDIGAGHTNTLGTREVVPDIIESLSQGLEEAGSIAISGTITDTLSAANCEDAAYICITFYNNDETPLYIHDWYEYDNTLCRSILQQKHCSGPNCLTAYSGEYYEDRHICFGYANDLSAGGEAARSACRSDLGIPDAEVAEIVDEDVKQFLKSRVFTETGETWIGFSESRTEAGSGSWLSGTQVTWTDWYSGRQNLDGYTCVSVQNDGGHYYQWEDKSCNDVGPTALCQFEHKCASDPCNGRGRCEPRGKDDHVCYCDTGYDGLDGHTCNINKDDCLGILCNNHGICIDGNNTFTCVCDDGYGGDTCGDEIDECDPNPCVNGGTCTDLINGYKCTCPAGYTDPQCYTDVKECVGRTCNNHGVCVDGIDSWHCVCFEDWTGDECEAPLPRGNTEVEVESILQLSWSGDLSDEINQNHQQLKSGILHAFGYNREVGRDVWGARTKPTVKLAQQDGKVKSTLSVHSPQYLTTSEIVQSLVRMSETVYGVQVVFGGPVPLESVTFSVKSDGYPIVQSQDPSSLCIVFDELGYCKHSSKCHYVDRKATCLCRIGWTGSRCDVAIAEEDDTARYIAIAMIALDAVILLLVFLLMLRVCFQPIRYPKPNSVYFVPNHIPKMY